MLGTQTMGLTIDVFGPISDNMGGIDEMWQLDEWVRERTDVLGAAGSTTAAIWKRFAIGSALCSELSASEPTLLESTSATCGSSRACCLAP